MTKYLILTQIEFDTILRWINSQNGWPDGRGTDRYAQPMIFNQFSNCPEILRNKVGLVFDKALIRNVVDQIGIRPLVIGKLERIGEPAAIESRSDKMSRTFRSITKEITTPSFVSIDVDGNMEEEKPTATFTFTSNVADVETEVKRLVN